MKKLNIKGLFVLLLASTTIITGCKKYLDQQPISEVGPDVVFADVPSAFQALAGAYSRLTGDQGYGIRLSLNYPVDNDEMVGPSGTQDDRRSLARMNPTPTNSELERPFNQLFVGIEYANICIDKIPKMDKFNNGTEIEKRQLQRMLGEALTLRAQFYFEAIRNWGDLPAHFQPAYLSAIDNPLPSQTGRDTLYDRIIEDLKTASSLVPWRNELGSIGDPQDERITKGTVKGLRARIALYRGGYSLRGRGPALGTMVRPADYRTYYQIARDEAFSIMNSGQHALHPSYKGLWKDYVCAHAVTDPNGELMFQVTGAERGATADTKVGFYNGPRVTTATGSTIGNASINPIATYFYSFDSTDERLWVTIAPYNLAADGQTKVGQALTALNDGKYRRDWVTNPTPSPTDATQFLGLKWQILRYSDVMLMFAEAENELNGPTALAYEAVNKIRRRGFGKPINTTDASVDLPAGLTQGEFFTRIVNERSWELGGEGVRKYDLIRWNLLDQKVMETRAELAAFAAGTGRWANIPTRMWYRNNSTEDDKDLWANSFYQPAPTTVPGATSVTWRGSAISTNTLARFASGYQKGRSELLPLPNAAVRDNPNLKQNPGN
jgi:starch-binding outer membrane protein, SusD/RagB family